MNWRTPLCNTIWSLKQFSAEQRDTTILWASELSGICDASVPKAPMPHVELGVGEDDAGELHLSWYWKAQHRTLTVAVSRDLGVSLRMLDQDTYQEHERPSHELLKRSVQCFFDGWLPNG